MIDFNNHEYGGFMRKKFKYRPKMASLVVSHRVLFFWETKKNMIGGRFKHCLSK